MKIGLTLPDKKVTWGAILPFKFGATDYEKKVRIQDTVGHLGGLLREPG